jgi:predicted neuraminidase
MKPIAKKVALVSWSAAALCRFGLRPQSTKSARGLAQSKTWRLLACSVPTFYLLAAGCATLPNESAIVKSEFIFETAPFPSCHASSTAETKSGLVAAWFGGTAERNPDVCIYVARQENGKWTPPVQVADGVGFATNRLPTWNPVLFQPKNGPLMLFYKVGPAPASWWGMMKTSTDDGKTWSQARRLPEGILGPIKNKPVQVPNGDILCGSSTEGDGGWRVHFERTKDFGKTWTATAPVNDGEDIGAIQPSILFHPNGKLQAIGRTRNDKLFQVWSDDGGMNWGKMTLLELPNPNSGTDAVTLRDGRQLLVYNHNTREGSNNKGRSPLNVAIGTDSANWPWFAALVLEDDSDAPNGFAYPAVIQTSDGLVHITYTWERKRIKHVVVDPAKLKLQPILHGQWPK